MRELIAAYRATLPADRRVLLDRFRFADMAHKVVGVGSVGTRAWILLMLGRDDDDPLFLQCKEAQPSVLAPYAGASRFAQPGPARRRGPAADAGRERHLPRLGPHDRARRQRARLLRAPAVGLEDLGRRRRDDGRRARPPTRGLCGATLARAHARCGDAVAIAAYLGSGDACDRAIADFAEAYAEQNERDHAALLDAIASGRVEAQTGV